MSNSGKVEIPAPEFLQHQEIAFRVRGYLVYDTISKRFYDIDSGCWYYSMETTGVVLNENAAWPKDTFSKAIDNVIEQDFQFHDPTT